MFCIFAFLQCSCPEFLSKEFGLSLSLIFTFLILEVCQSVADGGAMHPILVFSSFKLKLLVDWLNC